MNDPDMKEAESEEDPKLLVDGRDFYFEDGMMVLTRHFLLARGHCCGNGCRHCPYDTEPSSE